MKIAIAGSGALGSGFGAKLFQAGYNVTRLWIHYVEAVKQHGLGTAPQLMERHSS